MEKTANHAAPNDGKPVPRGLALKAHYCITVLYCAVCSDGGAGDSARSGLAWVGVLLLESEGFAPGRGVSISLPRVALV